MIAAIESIDVPIKENRFPKMFCSSTVKRSHNAVAKAFANMLASLAIGLLFDIVRHLRQFISPVYAPVSADAFYIIKCWLISASTK